MTASSNVPRKKISIRRNLGIGGGIIAVAVALWLLFGNSSSLSPNDGPPTAALPDSIRMGAVELNVSDLAVMRSYYEDAVGLRVLSTSDEAVELGFETPVIRLVASDDGLDQSSPQEAGLYHSEILYAAEADLARTLQQLATTAPASFQGSADHRVSLAFYFVDPEGNGLELYVDRPEDQWQWNDGEVIMGSEPLDPNAFIAEHLGAGTERPDVTLMGHVHLKVGDLEQAEEFYTDALGFAVTSRSDGALFYAAGGYHHHLATNIWQSDGAGERTNSTGLGAVNLTVGGTTALQDIADRFDRAGVDFELIDDRIIMDDPWGNEIRIVSR